MIKVGISGCGFVGRALNVWLEENNPASQIFVNAPPKGFNDDLSQIDLAFQQIYVPTEDDGGGRCFLKDVNAFTSRLEEEIGI